MTATEAARFWSMVDRRGPDECWPWLGLRSKRGYGLFYVRNGSGRKQQRAHRIAYEQTIGPIPDGLVPHHVCRTTWCCNPYHAQVLTQREHLQMHDSPSAVNRRRTCCSHGHPLSGANLYNWRGHRYCRICRKERKREHGN